MLYKVQLLVGAGRPEFRAIVNKILVLYFPFFVRKSNGGFFLFCWIREHIVHTISGIGQQRICLFDRYISVDVADIM